MNDLFEETYTDEDGVERCSIHDRALYPIETEDGPDECADCYFRGA